MQQRPFPPKSTLVARTPATATIHPAFVRSSTPPTEPPRPAPVSAEAPAPAERRSPPPARPRATGTKRPAAPRSSAAAPAQPPKKSARPTASDAEEVPRTKAELLSVLHRLIESGKADTEYYDRCQMALYRLPSDHSRLRAIVQKYSAPEHNRPTEEGVAEASGSDEDEDEEEDDDEDDDDNDGDKEAAKDEADDIETDITSDDGQEEEEDENDDDGEDGDAAGATGPSAEALR